MSLFKPLRGDSSRLDSQPFHDGYAYLTTNDGNFYIDATDDEGNQKRIHINKQNQSGNQSNNQFDTYNKSVSWNEDETVYTESWTENGTNYQKVMTIVSDSVYTMQLVVNGVNSGLWTMTFDETNRTYNSVYTAQ